MTSGRDPLADLPTPPPPRPDRREATIAAAMQRFDGREALPRPQEQPKPVSARWRLGLGRPQFGALVTAGLVASIGLPIWLSGDFGTPPTPSRQPAATTRQAPATLASPAERAAPMTAAPPSPIRDPAAAPIATESPVAAKDAPVSAAKPQGEPYLAEASAPAPPPAASVVAPAPPPPPPPPPPPAPALAMEQEDSAQNIVITGSRIAKRSQPSGSAETRRHRAELRRQRVPLASGWNACTVNDPARDVGRCSGLLGSSTPGPAGRATVLVGDGVMRAWRGDLDVAIARFDQAIAIAPRLAPAYLNRGLALARKGDDARALADLDQAVRRAPNDPRGYRARSLVLRQRGETRRADADDRRAAELADNGDGPRRR